MKHQTPSESPTGAGDHRGLVLGISPRHPSIEEPLMMIVMMKMMKMMIIVKMMKVMKMMKIVKMIKMMKIMKVMKMMFLMGVQMERGGYGQAI